MILPATYAISYRDTGAILSYCQLKNRDLSVKGAVDALLGELVGENLSVSLSKPAGPPIKIPTGRLHLDEVEADTATLEKFVRAPHDFVLDLSDPAATPGDGKKKTIIPPTLGADLDLNSGALATDPNTFIVKVAPDFPSGTQLF